MLKVFRTYTRQKVESPDQRGPTELSLHVQCSTLQLCLDELQTRNAALWQQIRKKDSLTEECLRLRSENASLRPALASGEPLEAAMLEFQTALEQLVTRLK